MKIGILKVWPPDKTGTHIAAADRGHICRSRIVRRKRRRQFLVNNGVVLMATQCIRHAAWRYGRRPGGVIYNAGVRRIMSRRRKMVRAGRMKPWRKPRRPTSDMKQINIAQPSRWNLRHLLTDRNQRDVSPDRKKPAMPSILRKSSMLAKAR